MLFVPLGILLVIATLEGDWYVVIKAYINFLYRHTDSIIIVLKHIKYHAKIQIVF